MRRIRIAGLCLVAVFALSAVIAGSASASTPLTLKTAKGTLAPGAKLKAFSSNLVFSTSAGNLECTENTLLGSVETNGAAKDKGKITEEFSTGTGGGACNTTTLLGKVLIKSNNFPWPLELTNKGTSKLKGSKKVAFEGNFFEASVNCNFEAGKVATTFKVGGPLELVTSNQQFKINKKTSNALCPKEGHLSGSFVVTSGGETVES